VKQDLHVSFPKKMRQPSFFAPRKKHLAAEKNPDGVDFLHILFTDFFFFWDRRINVIREK